MEAVCPRRLESGAWLRLHQARYPLFFFALAAVLLLFPSARRLALDPSNEAVLPRDAAFRGHLAFERLFGGDDSIAAALITPDTVLKKDNLEWLEALAAAAGSWPEVLRVRGLSTLKLLEKHRLGLRSREALTRWRKGEETLSGLGERLLFERPITRELVSGDFRTALTEIVLKPGITAAERHLAVTRAKDWVRAHPPADAFTSFSGSAVEQDALITAMQRDHRIFVPLTFLFVMALTAFFYGHWKACLYPAAVIGTALVSVQALMTFLGLELNPMTLLTAPLLVIVSVSGAVHFQSRANRIPRETAPGERLRLTLSSLAVPYFFTCATTAAGLWSLVFNPVPAVREFGLTAGTGTFIAYFWTLFLAPFFLDISSSWSAAVKTRRGKPRRRISLLAGLAVRRGRFVIAAFGLAAIASSLYGLGAVKVSTDILSAFSEDHPFRRGTGEIQKSMGGIYPLEFLIEAPEEGAAGEAGNFKRLTALKQKTETWNGVSHTRYVTDLFFLIHRVLGHEGTPGGMLLKKYAEGIAAHPEDTAFLASPGFKETRMTLFLSSPDTARIMELAELMRTVSERTLGPGWKVSPAGQIYLLARMSQNLVKGQITSLAGAVVLIGLLMAYLLRSLKLALICFISNLIPVAAVFALMPVFGIPLDTASAATGCLALGLIVDNAIHLLYRMRRTPRFPASRLASARVFTSCFPPIVISNLVLAGGFAACLFGSIRPTVHFGFLMVLVIFLGLISNVFFLLALYFIFPEKKKGPSQ